MDLNNLNSSSPDDPDLCLEFKALSIVDPLFTRTRARKCAKRGTIRRKISGFKPKLSSTYLNSGVVKRKQSEATSDNCITESEARSPKVKKYRFTPEAFSTPKQRDSFEDVCSDCPLSPVRTVTPPSSECGADDEDSRGLSMSPPPLKNDSSVLQWLRSTSPLELKQPDNRNGPSSSSIGSSSDAILSEASSSTTLTSDDLEQSDDSSLETEEHELQKIEPRQIDEQPDNGNWQPARGTDLNID